MKRVEYLDRARAFGMFLVYYGHFVQKLIQSGGGNYAAVQWRLIYSFHMPLFFFLAGIFWRPNPDFLSVFKDKLKTRIVPWLTFSLLLVPLWLIFDRSKMLERLLSGSYLVGNPKLNIVTWFLVCLFVVELLATLTAKLFKFNTFRVIIYAVGFFLVGYYAFIRNPSTVLELTGVSPDSWYIDDAFMAIPFYFAGYLLSNLLIPLDENRIGWYIGAVVMLFAGYGVLATFRLNVEDKFYGVLMISSRYGNAWYFLLTAFLGIFFTLGLSRFVAVNFSPVRFVGQNTIIFLGLNGICQHFLDRWVIDFLHFDLNSHLVVFLYTAIYVILMMMLFAPVAIAMRRWMPELIGLEWSSTSLLPPMKEWHEHGIGVFVSSFFKKFVIN